MPQVIVAVNKMDWLIIHRMYIIIVIEYADLAKALGLEDVTYILSSALNSDNIKFEKSEVFPTFEGSSLLQLLKM